MNTQEYAYINLWEQKVAQKKFWSIRILELQLAVDPLGGSLKKSLYDKVV